ncbi:uncharacterized protein C3orf20 homolog [Sceloporus undulatus]|uniref:uncharacterized protein C3orf20 homolog n=1 Tax=Sceloporus undulatus TaxID=8520 RepID=UPI001C4D1588|nr:uncharacterized protein C3orf20 homolog [Sceloporus undulatus]
MSDHKADSKGDQKSNPKSEQKDSPKIEQKAEQKDEQKDDTKKNLDYEHIKAKAPRILAEMVHMLLRWQKMGFHVPRGVKNIFEFTWDELMVSPQRKSFTGLYCPIVKFLPFDEADFSSTATSRAQKVPPSASMPKANYVTPSFENHQMLLKFQKRSVHLLTELLKVKMKIMIDAVAGPSSEEIARKLLEAGQQLCPKTQEEASDFMSKEPRRKGRGIVPTIPAIQISSTTQLIQQMSVSCLCFSLSLKDSKQQKGTVKGGGSSVQDKESQADKFDPCPQAREKIREICQRIEEEKAAAIAKGHTRPLILRNYITVHKSPSQALKRGSLSQTAAEFRRSKGKKMYFALPDGTVMMYYPSGSIAVLQFPICCSGRTVTLLFQDAPGRGLLGTLVSLGHSSVSYSFKSRCQIALLMNQEGGSVRDKDGFLTHNWSWYSKNQVLQSIEFQINEQLKLKVLGHNSMTLTFTSLNEAINISLTRPGCTHGAKQMPLRNPEGDDKEGHWIRSLTELRRRFEKTVKQFINGVLMISGICCIDYPLEYSSAKQVKFMVRESPIHAWGRKLRDETHATVLEGKGKPDARALISRYITTYQAFKEKQRPASREPVTSPQDAVPVPDTWALSTDCPNVLRRILAKESDIVGCKCVVKIPLITDVEFEKFIAAPRNPHQVLVICILSPENHSYSPFFEWSVEKIYVQMQHGRPSPCVQCKHDPFRFLRYDLENPLNKKPPLLVEKHAVVPGMVVMYAGGKLLFGSNVFNGYSYSKRDLLKQINQVCLECKMGHFLPPSFKFSPTAESPTTTFKVVESLNNMKIKEFFSEVQPTVQRKKKVEAKRVSSAKHVSSARKKSKK